MNELTFEDIPVLSMCTPDIEYLTVSITNTAEPYTVAVIYRPPSGNLQLFNQELLNFMSQLPDKNVFIMGDFNINLHNITNKTKKFNKTKIHYSRHNQIIHLIKDSYIIIILTSNPTKLNTHLRI